MDSINLVDSIIHKSRLLMKLLTNEYSASTLSSRQVSALAKFLLVLSMGLPSCAASVTRAEIEQYVLDVIARGGSLICLRLRTVR